jgi:hypothetical protein
MRQFIIATAMAVGLIVLWAAVLPLTAEPAAKQAVATSPAMSKAVFLCRGRNGLDQACVEALAKAFALDAKADGSDQVSNRLCRDHQQALTNLRSLTHVAKESSSVGR